jgi:cytoskeletal protein RodZ
VAYFDALPANAAQDVVTFLGSTPQAPTLTNDNRTTHSYYGVVAGSDVTLSWQVTGAISGTTKVQYDGQDDPSTSSTTIGPLKRTDDNSSYTLAAINAPTGATPASDTSTIVIRITPPPIPVSPSQLAGDVEKDGIHLSWSYNETNALAERQLTGFEVYRADSAGKLPTLVATLTGVSTLSYVDAVTPTCGRTYYVTAVYTDFDTGVSTQTASSANSWISPPCS